MSDSDLAAQLALLQEVLGKKVGLCDGSDMAGEAQEAAAMEKTDEPSWETWQTKDERPTTTSNDWNRDPPAKRANIAPTPVVQEGPRLGVGLDCSALRVGETVGDDVSFCPWKTLVAYPSTFIGKTNRPRARPFFDTILEDNSWDFFYLHDPRKPQEPAHLLVPTTQLESFLAEINQALFTALTIPPGVNRARFSLKFGNGGVPRPRYLTHSNNERDLDHAPRPAISDADIQGFNEASRAQQHAFVTAFEKMTSVAINLDRKRKAQERANRRAVDRQGMMDRAQTLLGLQEGSHNARAVFVCMDLEALEVSPHPISEVGVAILDASDLGDDPPGPGGSNWWQLIKAYHLRTKEHSGVTNHRYVAGCPGAFDFGASTFPREEELAGAIMSILEPYIGGQRDIVFVAHDVRQDIRYLSRIGLEVHHLPGMVGEIDTKELHQAWHGCDTGRGLQSVLSDLGIASANLHNAGNDAVFTMRGMICLAVEQLRKDEANGSGDEYVPALWTG